MPGNQTDQRIKELLAKFVLKYDYWGYLFSIIRRKPSDNFPSIMGVAPEMDGTITLWYNPKLTDGTNDKNIRLVLEHEGMHLLNKHVARLIRILSDETDITKFHIKRDLWNFAADAAANQQAKFEQTLCINGETWPLIFPSSLNLPDGKTTEWYFHELLKKNKDSMDKLSEEMKKIFKMLENHSEWGKGLSKSPDPNSLSRKIDSFLTDIIKKSVRSFSKDRGNLPAHIQELVEQALGPPKVPYYALIKKLIKGSRLSKFKRSHTKVNRKRGYVFIIGNKGIPEISPFPGRTRDFTFKVGIVIDTSGSMLIQWIAEGLSGVKNILEKDRHCHVTVMQVDTVIESEYQPKKIRDIKFEAKGRGGTSLFPGLERCKELGVDVCLAFTDGFCENINQISRKLLPKKIIWILTPNGSINNINKTGYVIKI